MKMPVALVLGLVILCPAGLDARQQAAAGRAPAAQVPAQKPPAQPVQKPAAPAQAAPAPAQAAPQVPVRRPAAPATRLTMTVFVTDATGSPVPDVRVVALGSQPREGKTTREGSVKLQGLRAGTYRLHFEAEGFVTLEHDVVVKGGTSNEAEVTLTRAPEPPKPVEPPPAPKPEAAAEAPGRPLPPADPNAAAEVLSVVDWLSKNSLKRGEGRKEAVVARSAGVAGSVLQVRDGLYERVHPDADELIYVINGKAVFSSKGRQQSLDTGALLLVPHGVTFTLENRGREPLWALSVLSPGN